ncbi:MAG: hypothetical protein WA944_24030 [Mycobacterium sp.]
MSADWVRARAVADAVLYEGYLLYPYRATSAKNQSRWQFGVLGPQDAEQGGIGENSTLSADVLIQPGGAAALSVVVRFLQLQHRAVERATDGGFEAVDELVAGDRSWLRWDEAVEHEIPFGPIPLGDLDGALRLPLVIPAGREVETVDAGRLVRTRRELRAELNLVAEPDGALTRVSVAIHNLALPATDKDGAIATSLIGTHALTEVQGGQFVSLLEPPPDAAGAVARCRRHRCFPVLAGPAGVRDLMLISPIILYDHPEIAEQSDGALYDSTEIDEILTLRIMTMTGQEKAQARATDPLAAAIIDRCDTMSPEALLNLHGVLRDPHAATGDAGLVPQVPDGVDWWDPMVDNAVNPGVDAVLVDGVRVSCGSRVRLRPTRRADAQDLFYADKVARVTSVHETVDGETHVGVVIEDDPAADLHEWYGRYLYFAPDEVEPLDAQDLSPERSSTWR